MCFILLPVKKRLKVVLNYSILSVIIWSDEFIAIEDLTQQLHNSHVSEGSCVPYWLLASVFACMHVCAPAVSAL